MTTRTLLLVAAVALVAVGTWLILATVVDTAGPSCVTILNYDPPGLPYTLITLRSGPRSESTQIGFLEPGTTAQAIGRDTAGGWLLLDEPRGWMSVSAGEVSGDIDALPVTDAIIEPPHIPLVSLFVAEDSKPVEKRLGPAEVFSAIALLEAGDSGVAIARDPAAEWVLVEPPGWIAVRTVEITGDVMGLPVIHIDF